MRPLLGPLDYLVIGAWLLLAGGISVLFVRRASRDTEGFFLAGRGLPWWLAGPAMLGALLAFEVPLAAAQAVRGQGISGSWPWWSAAIAQILAVFLFSRLWNRAGVTTDNELLELRYSGRAAAGLRGVKAVLLGGVLNVLVMAWALRTMAEILPLLLPVGQAAALVACVALALACVVLSGLYGVAALELAQLVIGLCGATALAVVAVDRVGGMEMLEERLIRHAGRGAPMLDLLPPLSDGAAAEPLAALLVLVLVAWWATPFADGGGLLAQRMSACRTERHSLLATLLSSLLGLLRTWPWIVAALVSLVLFPALSTVPLGDASANALLVDVYLGPGTKGLLVVVFLAGLVSTLAAQLAWGASYVVHDVYRRFIRPQQEPGHYVLAGRLVLAGLVAAAVATAMLTTSFRAAFELVFLAGSGLGLVVMLRWFWWRISAVTEIAALSTSLVLALANLAVTLAAPGMHLLGRPVSAVPLHFKVLAVVPVSLLVAVVATFLSQPVPTDVLERFYRRVRPGGFWGILPPEVTQVRDRVLAWRVLVDWVAGLALAFGVTFATGAALFGNWLQLIGWSGLAAGGGAWTALSIIRMPGKGADGASAGDDGENR